MAHGYSNPESSPLNILYFGLTALFWIGHRLGSTWLACCTEAYRPLLRSNPVRFVLLPLLVTSACFLVFLPVDEALPWTRGERLVGLAILDYALVTYHFAAQHYGALSLYRMRAERVGCAHTKRLDRIFALGVGGALIFLADILAGAAAYQHLWIDDWLVAAWLAAMVAIALQPRSLFLFLVLWTSQHWILATGLASQTPGGYILRRLGFWRPCGEIAHFFMGSRINSHRFRDRFCALSA